MSKLNTIFFDLDGTLTDPARGILGSYQAAFHSANQEPPAEDILKNCIGPPLADCFRNLGVEPGRVPEFIVAYRHRYRERGMLENRVYPGVPEVLARLRREGYRLHVATSKPQEFAVKILDHFNLLDFFEFVFGPDLDGNLSDKGELLTHARGVVGFLPETSAMIGDREFDVSAARLHGLFSVGVLWGYGSRDELQRAGAAVLVSEPSAIPGVL